MHSIKYSVCCRAFNSNLYSIRYMQGISRGICVWKGRCGRRERIGAEKRADGVREEGGRRISDKEGGVGVPDGVRSAG